MKKVKRILAIIGVVIIGCLALAAFVAAVFIRSVGKEFFTTLFIISMLVPVCLYLLFWLMKIFGGDDEEKEKIVIKDSGFDVVANLNKKGSLKKIGNEAGEESGEVEEGQAEEEEKAEEGEGQAGTEEDLVEVESEEEEATEENAEKVEEAGEENQDAEEEEAEEGEGQE